MKIYLQGDKYYLSIIFDQNESNKFEWSLYAYCKKSQRYSSINNLNFVLSELNVDSSHIDYWESFDWIVSEIELLTFNDIITKIFNDKNDIHYFEKQLDTDRNEGEWENVI